MTIASLTPADANRLATFFEAVAKDAEVQRFFNPHPLTYEYARWLCSRVRHMKDRYYLTYHDGLVVAYSMLRGWDEGYVMPSWGGCVAVEARDMGIGRKLLRHAASECLVNGAMRLRLTVHKSNERGVHLYQSVGFQLSPLSEDKLVGWWDLCATPVAVS